MILELPYPPSTNHNAYWGVVGHRRYLTARAKAFRADVCAAARLREGFQVPLAMTVDLYPTDRRKRDIDNPIKALMDALQHAGVIADDCLVDRLIVTRRMIVKGGKCVVTLEPLNA